MCILYSSSNKQICTTVYKCNGVTFLIQFMHGCVHCAIERACVLSAPDIFEPNRNFDVVLLDAEEYDG